MDRTEWVLAQIADARPPDGLPGIGLPALISLLAALRGHGGHMIFGMVPSALGELDRPRVVAAGTDALLAWRDWFATHDRPGVIELSKVAELVGVPALSSERFALQCDPLGGRDGLAPEWQLRLDRLESVVRGASVAPVYDGWFDGSPLRVSPPNLAALYQAALAYEANYDLAFSRILAAWWSIAGAVEICSVFVLQPPNGWEWIDREDETALRLGEGVACQGSLLLVPTLDLADGGDLADSPIISFDDDGVECARFASFGALVDVLLGAVS